MKDERRRILQMLSEGSISLEECESLLDALEEKRKPQEPPPERSPLPFHFQRALGVFLVVVAVWFVLQWFAPLRLLLLVLFPAFWIWMIVDCACRDPGQFPAWDKRSWLLLVVLVPVIGAVIYKIVVVWGWWNPLSYQ